MSNWLLLAAATWLAATIGAATPEAARFAAHTLFFLTLFALLGCGLMLTYIAAVQGF